MGVSQDGPDGNPGPGPLVEHPPNPPVPGLPHTPAGRTRLPSPAHRYTRGIEPEQNPGRFNPGMVVDDRVDVRVSQSAARLPGGGTVSVPAGAPQVAPSTPGRDIAQLLDIDVDQGVRAALARDMREDLPGRVLFSQIQSVPDKALPHSHVHVAAPDQPSGSGQLDQASTIRAQARTPLLAGW